MHFSQISLLKKVSYSFLKSRHAGGHIPPFCAPNIEILVCAVLVFYCTQAQKGIIIKMKKNGVRIIRIIYVALMIACLLIAGSTFFFDKRLFYVVFPLAVVITAISSIFITRVQHEIYGMIRSVNQHLKPSEHSGVAFPMPVVIVSDSREIIWYNELFETSVVGGEEILGMRFDKVSDKPLDQFCSGQGAEVNYNGKSYIAYGICDDINDRVYMLYFSETTQLKKLAEEYLQTRPVVMLILIDNYEELLQNAKESEKSQLLGQIDYLLEEFISKTNGFIRKLDRDRFIAVIEEHHLAKLAEERFPILDAARQLQTAYRYPVTLSIGIGRGGKSMAESEVWSRQAIDMALGRGGDQVAIKNATGFEFFGGVSKGVEKRTKVKTRIIANALAELMETSDNVIVMGHKFGDLDSMGSSIAMAMAARCLNKHSVVCVDRHHNLATCLIDRQEKSGITDLFVEESEALGMITPRTLLIILDTHNPGFVESGKLYESCKTVVVIDHHRKMVNHIDNAVIFYHEPFASSASEMVTELLQYLGDGVVVNRTEAEALLAGIMLDTKNFVLKTGVRTFEAAAFLRRMGADTVEVRKLFAGSMESYQRKTKLVASAQIYKRCAIACSNFSSDDLRIVAPQAADELLNISGVDASFVLYEVGDGVSISARSMGQMNVQIIMEMMGGGGHLTMAGAQVECESAEKVKQLLLTAIDKYTESLK